MTRNRLYRLFERILLDFTTRYGDAIDLDHRVAAVNDAITVLGLEFDLTNKRNLLVAAVIDAARGQAAGDKKCGWTVSALHDAFAALDAFDAKLATDEPPHVNGLVQGAAVDERALADFLARTKTTVASTADTEPPPPPLGTGMRGTRQNTCCRCGWGMTGPWDGASLCTSCGGEDGPTVVATKVAPKAPPPEVDTLEAAAEAVIVLLRVGGDPKRALPWLQRALAASRLA